MIAWKVVEVKTRLNERAVECWKDERIESNGLLSRQTTGRAEGESSRQSARERRGADEVSCSNLEVGGS